jgi:outer membrane biosynthesis protein TonB
MTVVNVQTRWKRVLVNPLALAFAISILIHGIGGLLWGSIAVAQRASGARASDIRSALARMAQQAEQQKQAGEPRLTFMDVDPLKASDEAPENAKHYGAVSTRAANPESSPTDQAKPNIDGQQQPFDKLTESRPYAKAVDEPSRAFPLQPDANARPEQESPSDRNTRAGQQKALAEGDTQMAKAQPRPTTGATFGDPDVGLASTTQQRPRPRSVSEARARLGGDPGPRTLSEGGVARQSDVGFDVKGSRFGAYDQRFVDAVREAWFKVMGSRVMGGAGQVQVRFHLRSDGRIENLVVVRSSVDELMTYYCRRAIEAPAPFEVWPPEMLREIGSTSREITFTFHYLQ